MEFKDPGPAKSIPKNMGPMNFAIRGFHNFDGRIWYLVSRFSWGKFMKKQPLFDLQLHHHHSSSWGALPFRRSLCRPSPRGHNYCKLGCFLVGLHANQHTLTMLSPAGPVFALKVPLTMMAIILPIFPAHFRSPPNAFGSTLDSTRVSAIAIVPTNFRSLMHLPKVRSLSFRWWRWIGSIWGGWRVAWKIPRYFYGGGCSANHYANVRQKPHRKLGFRLRELFRNVFPATNICETRNRCLGSENIKTKLRRIIASDNRPKQLSRWDHGRNGCRLVSDGFSLWVSGYNGFNSFLESEVQLADPLTSSHHPTDSREGRVE